MVAGTWLILLKPSYRPTQTTLWYQVHVELSLDLRSFPSRGIHQGVGVARQKTPGTDVLVSDVPMQGVTNEQEGMFETYGRSFTKA